MQRYDNRDGTIWYNGEFIDWRSANLHVLSHGLNYGACVFEGIRTYNGKPFRLEDHLKRLEASAKTVGFALPYSLAELVNAVEELRRRDKLSHAYIRPCAWRGANFQSIAAPGSEICVAIAGWEWSSFLSDQKRQDGVRLAFSTWRRPSTDCAFATAKVSANYAVSTLAMHEAAARSYDDAILCGPTGDVAEACGANVFAVYDGRLKTPPADCFLAGITRDEVFRIADTLGISSTEGPITRAQLLQADEVFLCGTAYEIQPVAEIEGHRFGSDRAVTRQIRDKYQRRISGE